MFIMRFTERPYVAYTEDDVRRSFRSSVRLTFPNSHFNPELGADLYNEYLDEYEFSEEVGFDGLMLNEHHNTPTCMGATMNLEAAILARITKKPKIVLLGNPLPIFDNPIRLAEELAEIDMISRGRLVSGFVRGTGIESWATNTNPVHNRERFEEAHDLIIKTWTTPGPFRWEGKHYHFRVVNPFERPLQKPHPPIWIPGVGSPETLEWCARHHYPVHLSGNRSAGDGVDDRALRQGRGRECGYQPGPQNFGYLWRIHVQDTDEKATEVGKGFLAEMQVLAASHCRAILWRRRVTTRARVRSGILEQYKHALRPDPLYGGVDSAGWDAVVESNRVVVGSPKTVIKKIRAGPRSISSGNSRHMEQRRHHQP